MDANTFLTVARSTTSCIKRAFSEKIKTCRNRAFFSTLHISVHLSIPVKKYVPTRLWLIIYPAKHKGKEKIGIDK